MARLRPPRSRPARVGGAVSLVLTLAAALIALPSLLWPGAAHAAAYRYWTYWQGGTGSWTFATACPAALIPADGSVEGWRFAVTTQAGKASDAPATDPSFAEICGQRPAVEGSKRVALVIDPGPASSAPEGQAPPPAIVTCVEIQADATGYQVLRSVAVVRTENGLICGIDDYPTGECAPVIEDVPQSPSAGPTSSAVPAAAPAQRVDAPSEDRGTPWATAGVVAVAAALGGLLLWRRRHG